jgi:hypothetical protein
MSSWFWWTKQEQPKAPTNIETIDQLDNSIQSLKARRMKALYNADTLEKEAKSLDKIRDKQKILGLLKRKQVYTNQVAILEGQIANLEQTSMAVDSAGVSADIVQTMKDATANIKQANIDVVEIQEVSDDLGDQMRDIAEINRALSAPLGMDVAEEEDLNEKLLEEIASWDGLDTETRQKKEADDIAAELPSIKVDTKNNNNNNNNGNNSGKPILLKE